MLSLEWIEMRFFLFITVVIGLSLAQARAEDGCGKFAWPLAHEQTLLNAANKQDIKAGDTLAALPQVALTLNLQGGDKATFAMPPERKPKVDHWYGGALYFPAPAKAGLYQITLSNEAWIDLVQNGKYARSIGHSGRGDCPGLRKSVRFELAATPFTLQISGTDKEKIGLVVSQAP
jgi:hypothetical protein